LIYVFVDFNKSFSASPAKSRHISGEQIAPRVQRAMPATNWSLSFKWLENEKFKGVKQKKYFPPLPGVGGPSLPKKFKYGPVFQYRVRF